MDETVSQFRICLSNALQSDNIQEQVNWLEKALEDSPERIEDVLRVAVILQNLSSRISGSAYIKKLEELAEEQKRKNKRKSP